MAEVESEDHKVTAGEREFWRALTVILSHLKDRALNAEDEVVKLRTELTALRERIEYDTLILEA